MKLLTGLACILMGTSAFASSIKVIYGEDNRHDVMNYPDRDTVAVSRSTVALVKSSALTPSGNQFTIPTTTFKEKMKLCSGERFSQQPAAAFCSGFLVAPNKIMTAGHCITSADACAETRFLFDYKMINESRGQTVFTQSQVYSCKKILGWEKNDRGADFAVIELDREVTDRVPMKLATNVGLKVKDELMVIGHPSGLPTKITDRAFIRNIQLDAGYLMANLDTYGGNSGSAVLNVKTLEVEGILVRGEKDFETNSVSECRSSYRTGENAGRGEDVTLISAVVENGVQGNRPVESNPDYVRYVWLESDQTCNEFEGDEWVDEVDESFCNRGDAAELRYVWLDSDNTCNEFRGNDYVREVNDTYCGRGAAVRYVWLPNDSTCNEFRGTDYVREVADSLCGRASTNGLRYVWLSNDQTCNLFNGTSFIREVANENCGH